MFFMTVIATSSKASVALLEPLAVNALQDVAFEALLHVTISVVDATFLTSSKVLRFLRGGCYCYVKVLRARNIKILNGIVKNISVILLEKVVQRLNRRAVHLPGPSAWPACPICFTSITTLWIGRGVTATMFAFPKPAYKDRIMVIPS